MDLIDQKKLSEHIHNWAMKPETTSSRRKNTFQTKGILCAKSWRRKAHGVCEELKGNQVWLKDNRGGGDETRLGRMIATNAGKTGITFMKRNLITSKCSDFLHQKFLS